MSKKIEINITLYSPKELWERFWNRFYWPRRKSCAEWVDFAENYVDGQIGVDIFCHLEDHGIHMESDEATKLELLIKEKLTEGFNVLRQLIIQPI